LLLMLSQPRERTNMKIQEQTMKDMIEMFTSLIISLK